MSWPAGYAQQSRSKHRRSGVSLHSLLIALAVASCGDPRPIRALETAHDNIPIRWKLSDQGIGIYWDVRSDKRLPHRDNVEMSGRQISAIITYGVDDKGGLVLDRKVVWPMLRTLPENTHANVIRDFGDDAELSLLIDGNPVVEKPTHFYHEGVLGIVCATDKGIETERMIFPATNLPLVGEVTQIRNVSNRALTVELVAPTRKFERTDPKKSRYGVYELGVYSSAQKSITLAPASTATVMTYVYGQKESARLKHPIDVAAELQSRRDFVDSLSRKLVLETPDANLNRMFALAKIRAAESIYATKGGLLHSPGGGRYYAAIWANDQAEYINPFFPFLGDETGNASAINAFRHFARFMNERYKPIPSSIISEGDRTWHGRGDRGDMAMIAYGTGRFALAYGDRKAAEELWPLISWCLEYCRRKVNDDGVVESDSDELEGRFPSGKANLCTSTLYYDALLSATMLGKELAKPNDEIGKYRQQAVALRQAIERYFGATVEGYPTYRYYDGNKALRAWICIPLTMGIFDRRDGTINALFSKQLWTPDGLASQSGDKTFWDRATLYALRGVFAAGETKRGLEYLTAYTERRLTGDHVPYPVEAWPEGNQRHLSAESGLYCRIFTEGLFGIRPTGFNSFDCTPHVPDAWTKMALRSVQAFGHDFDIAVERDREKLEITVQGRGLKRQQIAAKPNETIKIELTPIGVAD